MAYEQAIRDKAATLMNRGRTKEGNRYDIMAALEAARNDVELRSEEFLEPLQMQAAPSNKPDRRRSRSRSRGKGRAENRKGDKKGNGRGDKKPDKGKGASNISKLIKNKNVVLATEKDGTPIVFRWNRDRKCERRRNHHVCQICLSPDHPFIRCPQNKK